VLQETDDIRGRFWASFDAYTEAIRAAACDGLGAAPPL
jgi:hypothetical protein